MEILHAVEDAALSQGAVKLVVRLRFRAPKLTLVHVLQRLEPPLPADEKADSSIASKFFRLQEDSAREELSTVKRWYEDENLLCRTTLTSGFTTSALLKEVESQASDLVVISSGERSEIERIVSPSISESFLHQSRASILIVKGHFNPSSRIKALLATDHSDYCTRAIGNLLEFLPSGIDELTVTSCFSKPLCHALASLTPEEAEVEGSRWKDALSRKARTLRDKLTVLTPSITSLVSTEPPSITIPRLLQEHDSNLLILGAQGHGFFERLAMGSTSHELLRRSTCSVLVLRVNAAKSN